MRTVELHSCCQVCGGTDLRHKWVVNGYTIARCAACSLVFVQNAVTAEDLEVHYAGPKDEVYEDNNSDCLSYYYEKLSALIKKRFPQPGRILDVGCSRGWFFDVMTGWECYGNEIVAADAEAARQKHGNRIFTGSFDDYPMREEFFDVITLQDVFDHMRNPLEALGKCLRMLRPNGLIAIKVHNISCLYAQLTGSSYYALVPPSHLFYYDPKTLAATVSKCGFEVVDSKFIAHRLKLKTVFWRLSRSDTHSLSFRIYQALNGTSIGEFKIHKNLHDIFTMLAVKPS